MKIVVLNGSPRKGGNTEIMAQAFAEAARKNQNEVSVLDVASMNICGCLGCKYCWAHKGECVQKDDMGKVLQLWPMLIWWSLHHLSIGSTLPHR